jgi:transcriptional regulator with XRE-family HTH domain
MDVAADTDELDELIAERGETNPAFPQMVEEALRARQLIRELTEARTRRGLSQTVVAARMDSSQSVVARIEQGDWDVRLSTLARYAAAVGQRISMVHQRSGGRSVPTSVPTSGVRAGPQSAHVVPPLDLDQAADQPQRDGRPHGGPSRHVVSCSFDPRVRG